MNDAKSDFAMARCMEVMDGDEENNLLSHEIAEIEKRITSVVSDEAAMLLSELDNLKERQFSICIAKVYLAGFNDRIATF